MVSLIHRRSEFESHWRFVVEKNENKQKEGGFGPFKKQKWQRFLKVLIFSFLCFYIMILKENPSPYQ